MTKSSPYQARQTGESACTLRTEHLAAIYSRATVRDLSSLKEGTASHAEVSLGGYGTSVNPRLA